MFHNFFVHAEAPFDRDYQMSMQRGQYFQSIEGVVLSSSSSFRVSEEGLDLRLQRLIPDEKTLITYGRWDHYSANGGSGFVRPEDATRFIDIARAIKLGDEVLIHGAFYGQCPTDFAIQLWYALNREVFINPKSGMVSFHALELLESGLLEQSNIGLGIIFGTRCLESEKRLELTKQLHRPTTQFFR